ncbi:MAG: hypothetical protein IPP47_13020 [Bryobacterales bacterium]|nr:hypothetical protein [Bryobacterales bacterium]
MKFLSLLASLVLLSAAAAAAPPGDAAMQPFPMEWRNGSGALVDASSLLDAPAGKHGFLSVSDGHLITRDGRRFRIWGVNLTGAATVPSHEDAPAVAAHFARFGINCVRFHFLDRPAPTGLIDATRNDTRALDPKQLDRLDFFIAELKKRGIYSNLNLNVARTYKAGDGVRDYELIGYAKALTYFNPRLLELQREYATQLLTHRNPYTGAEYRSEPAIATVELVNENSIVEAWYSDRLLGQHTRKNPGTWSDIPASYEKELTALFHAWLAKRGLPPVARLTRREFETAPAARFRTEAAFYMELEERYFQSMRTLLRDELKVKALLAGTADHNHSNSGYPLLRSAASLDIIDGHTYWQHPRYFTDKETGKQTGWEITNTPMVDDPLHSTVVELSRSALAGKPYTVSEVNHPFPAEWAAEGVPVLAAYAAFHDWDGIYWYTFEHADPSEWRPRMPSFFEVGPDPVKMSQIAAGAYLFLRGDVRPAAYTSRRSYSLESVVESLRLPRDARPYFTPGFPLALPLVHATRITGLDGNITTGDFPPAQTPPLVSDTKEITWRKGCVTVQTDRWQSLTGGCTGELENLIARVENPFSSIALVSLDGAPLRSAASILLTTGARVANTGMQWNQARTSLTEWGAAPTLIEPVRGAITLRNLAAAQSVEVQPLDGAGRALGPPASATRTPAGPGKSPSAPLPRPGT